MLFGEHAVLHGKLSIVCAVNQTIKIRFNSRKDTKIIINSDIGRYQTCIKSFEFNPKFKFVLQAIDHVRAALSVGFELSISSDFSPFVGLGSSAAVTAATFAALLAHLEDKFDKRLIFNQGLKSIHKIQGTGSGADLAASVYGGILAYRAEPLEIHPLENTHPLSVIYSGNKTPTVTVIQKVNDLYKQFPDIVMNIFDNIDHTSQKAQKCISANDWPMVGKLLNINQGYLDALGVNNHILSDIVYSLRQYPEILGSKISGAGLGDCVIGLGRLLKSLPNHQQLPIYINPKGVEIE
jgi:mevalonate kinase